MHGKVHWKWVDWSIDSEYPSDSVRESSALTVELAIAVSDNLELRLLKVPETTGQERNSSVIWWKSTLRFTQNKGNS